ncbi:MAG: NAD(P)-dependent oxidoreductase [Betaproteobacteria bacterium]|jgi:3-hydroxyisobutyrate dehydrogenase|nr:NAD(P)-dependent oxidoreductase [Betaproteobacteria bacterium]MCC6246984.1 NAD(P)-dependent oxidoreductase [Rubrivivax sp.]
MKIAFLGTGLMGTGFVRRFLANGHSVNVWNRSADKARALEAHGAKAFADAAAAVEGVERIHVSLGDDASVDAVLEPLAGRIGAATWIIDHTTTAMHPTVERAARWAARGVTYVHAPVFMGPANCAEGTGLMLTDGPKARHEALLPHLQPMTGTVLHLGEPVGRAAAFKLFGNLAIIGINGVLGDVARLAEALGVAPADAFTLFTHFNPGGNLAARAVRIEKGPHSPASFETTMARKDVRLMIEEAQHGGVALALMPAVAALLDAAIARGEGALDIGAAMRSPGMKAVIAG